MNFHIQVLESQFLSLYQGLHLTNAHSNATVTPISIIRSDVPRLEVTHTADHVTGRVAICSPPPLKLAGSLPGNPVPKGKCHVCVVRLKELAKKEIALVECNKEKGKERRGVALKRKNETQN